jgi:hypothetical protein
VVALRETRRDASRPPLTVVRSRGVNDWTPYAAPSDGSRGVERGHAGAAEPSDETASTDITDLRDAEIERLLSDNARCNERIMFLLKVIEHEHTRNAAATAETVAIEMDRGAILRDVKASLDAELRPVLLVLRRLLEKHQQLRPADENARNPGLKAPGQAAAEQPCGQIADMGRKMDSAGEAQDRKMSQYPAGHLRLPKLRQRISRALLALRG